MKLHKRKLLTGILLAVFFFPFFLSFLNYGESPSKAIVKAEAAEDLLGYQNPEKIVIAMPNKNQYETTKAKISILGACDYRYPLTMNQTPLSITEHGFFTAYVSLKIGKNEFQFQNGSSQYTLTIIRNEKQSGGSSGGGNSPVYKTVKNKIGELIYPYTMPYQSPGVVKIDYLPLTMNTTFRIVGEIGSYYKLPDGTYVLKSSVKVYPYALPDNSVTAVKAVYNDKTHTLDTTLTMTIDALYDVIVTDNKVKLLLYDTSKAKKPVLPQNPMVKSVSVSIDSMGRAVYTYQMKDDNLLCGFDVTTQNGTMVFTMKYLPILERKGSLKGAVILLDAGHGGSDAGTAGAMGTAGPREKDTNLDITLRTKAVLEKMGAKVVLVREDDTYYSLNDRVSLIRTTKPDLSISIHGNAMDISSNYSESKGFLTYYSYQSLTDAPSIINRSVNESFENQVRGIRKANLSLTRLTSCPAVLLETAFLTCPEDYEFLLREKNRQAFAEAIANAAKDYLNEVAKFQKDATYIVKRGDTLTSIARRYQTTVSKLAELNKIKNVNVIHTGTVLILP